MKNLNYKKLHREIIKQLEYYNDLHDKASNEENKNDNENSSELSEKDKIFIIIDKLIYIEEYVQEIINFKKCFNL